MSNFFTNCKCPTAPAAVDGVFDHYRGKESRHRVPAGPVPVERMLRRYPSASARQSRGRRSESASSNMRSTAAGAMGTSGADVCRCSGQMPIQRHRAGGDVYSPSCSARPLFALALLACALGMLPARLLADEKPSMQSRPFQEKLAALLDDETLCVVYVDFTKLDTDAILTTAQAFVDKQLDKLGLTETDRDFLRASLQLPGADAAAWNLGKVRLKAGKEFLVETVGVREAFLVVQTGGKSYPALVWAAIPKHEKLNTTLLRAFVKMNSSLARETADFYFFAMLGPEGDDFRSLAGRYNLANLGPNRPAVRPEFMEAHQVLKDCPVQVLVAPPKYVKRVFRETNPTLPGVYQGIDIAAMPGALRWAAIGVKPEKLELVAVVNAESDSDAQLLYRSTSDLFSRASEELISSLRKYKETPGGKNAPTPDAELDVLSGAYPAVINDANLQQLGQFLIPKPEGRRFVVKINADTLQTVLDKAAPLVHAAIEKVIQGERSRQRSMLPENRLRRIALAVVNYNVVNEGTFPPSFSVDKNGKPLHSWRVLILPYLDEDGLAGKIRLNEPWDSPYNKQFHNQMPAVYYNAAYPGSEKKGETNFCMVVGPDSVGRADGKGLKTSEIKNGASRTIMLTERKTPVCWMAPTDIEREKARLGINKDPAGIGGKTPGGVFAAYANGAVTFLKETMPLDQLRASLKVNGGKAR